MKTKFKDLLLYSLAIIGVCALFVSAIPDSTNQVGTYQIEISDSQNALFRVNTITGDIDRIKKSNISKVDANN
ncbi:MAG: hypothetical protein P8K72_04770 [Flavobacteriaceae bacterium]|jgi:hypothetical protein|nr:hypothetical protein [Flavobacteriaceae bacterium]|tara:strand:- start:203 stop:421 length:219 start_codon:yes stop_codon:yes gene_type:complete